MRADVGGVELEYEVAGAGPELVWMHGLTGSLDSDRPLCERLSEHYRILWYSTRGHGRSSPVSRREECGYGAVVQDLERLLEVVGFECPLLAGGSHGANTALRHAATRPGRQAGLVLVAPGANALHRPRRAAWALVRAQTRRAERRGPDAVIRIISGQDPADPAADQAVLAAARTHDFASLATVMRYLPDQQVCTPAQVRRVAVPTVVAAWRRDPLIHPWSVAERIAALVPGARLVEIPRAGGLSPDVAAGIVRGLIDEVAAGGRPVPTQP